MSSNKTMSDGHLNAAALGRVSSTGGGFSATAMGDALEHLAGGCERCWSAVESQRETADARRKTRDEVALRRVLFAEEKRAVSERLREIEGTPPPERRALLSTPRYYTRAVFDGLLDLGRGATVRGELNVAERWFDAALVVLVNLEPRLYGAGSIEDQWARLWALLGNLRRLGDDFPGADAAFRTAYRHRERGTGDPLLHGDLLSLEATLRTGQRRFGEADALAQRAVDLFQEAGDKHLAGRALIKRVNLFHQQGDTEQALQLLHQAVAWIDVAREPRLALVTRHSQLNMLCLSGRVDEARQGYEASRSLYDRFDEPLMNLRRRWLEGRLALGEGGVSTAEALLRSAAEGFLERDAPYFWALVSLDRAQILADAGRHGELEALTARLVEVFQAQDIQRETYAALALLHRSAAARNITAAMLDEVARLLQFGPADRSRPS